MSNPAYPAARVVAGRVEEYFRQHIDAARERLGPDGAPKPDTGTVETLIDVAFWASLHSEEGYPPKISMAFLPPGQAGARLLFERPLPLAASVLTRLAPAVERPGIHLGVWPGKDGLAIWGATRTIPPLCLVLEVVSPGVIVIKHRRGEEGRKFINVVVLEGDRIKIIDQRGRSLPDCPGFVASLIGFDSPAFWAEPVNVLVELSLSMRAHGRGATLLVVPGLGRAWTESVMLPLPYAVAPPFDRLAELMRQDTAERSRSGWEEAFERVIDGIAGLTAVDGATILTDRYEVLGFGAKIVPRNGSPPVDRVVMTEPIEGIRPRVVHPSEVGGTRHLSGAQFAQDQRDAVALVASQDGRFTVFAWSPSAGMVRAHRVEALLL